MTTSEPRARRRKSSRPSGEPLRSIVIERLLRLRKWKLAPLPAGMPRVWSPSPGRSTLMTSAPRSASSSPAEGPAMMWPSSRTRSPSSGSEPFMAPLAYSLDHLVRPCQDGRGHGETQGLGSLDVDDEFQPIDLLDRDVGGVAAKQNALDLLRAQPARSSRS